MDAARAVHGGSALHGIPAARVAHKHARVAAAAAAPAEFAVYLATQLVPAAAFFVLPSGVALLSAPWYTSACMIPIYAGLAALWQGVCAYAYMQRLARSYALLAAPPDGADRVESTGAGYVDAAAVLCAVAASAALANFTVFAAYETTRDAHDYGTIRTTTFVLVCVYLLYVYAAALAFVCARCARNERAWGAYVARKRHACALHAECLCSCAVCLAAE